MLSHRQCERFDPAKLGGLPVIRFVPDSDLEDSSEDEKGDTVKITISKSTQEDLPGICQR